MANQWYYAQNGQQFGPAPGEQLRNMLSSGALRPSDLVWSEGMPAWTPASQVPALMPAPALNPPAPAYVQPPAPRPAPAYAPPASAAAYGHPGEVAEEVVGILRSTKPWVRFLSVLGFLGLGLLLLGCLAILVIPMGPMGSMLRSKS